MKLHDHELERRVIAWLINNPIEIDRISLLESDFHDETYKKIFEIIVSTYKDKGYFDDVLLKTHADEEVPEEAIEDVLQAESRGGVHYADELKKYAERRHVKKLCDRGIEMLENTTDSVLQGFDVEYLKVQRSVTSVMVPVDGDELADKYLEHWNEMKEKGGRYFRSGYDLIDDYVCWQPGKVYTIAARSSIGKSCLAQNIGIGMSTNGNHVMFISMEMDYIELSERILSVYSGVSNTKFKYGSVGQYELECALKKMRENQRNFYLNWDPSMTIQKITRAVYDMKNRIGLDVIIIDYLQLIRPHYNMKPNDSMHRFISEVTTFLKRLAFEIDVAIVLLSQVSRSQNESSPPTLNQLKESGSIENDSDCVLILHRDDRDSKTGQLIIAKNRSGPAQGQINLDFEPSTTLYKESSNQGLKRLNDGVKNAISYQESDDDGF